MIVTTSLGVPSMLTTWFGAARAAGGLEIAAAAAGVVTDATAADEEVETGMTRRVVVETTVTVAVATVTVTVSGEAAAGRMGAETKAEALELEEGATVTTLTVTTAWEVVGAAIWAGRRDGVAVEDVVGTMGTGGCWLAAMGSAAAAAATGVVAAAAGGGEKKSNWRLLRLMIVAAGAGAVDARRVMVGGGASELESVEARRVMVGAGSEAGFVVVVAAAAASPEEEVVEMLAEEVISDTEVRVRVNALRVSVEAKVVMVEVVAEVNGEALELSDTTASVAKIVTVTVRVGGALDAFSSSTLLLLTLPSFTSLASAALLTLLTLLRSLATRAGVHRQLVSVDPTKRAYISILRTKTGGGGSVQRSGSDPVLVPQIEGRRCRLDVDNKKSGDGSEKAQESHGGSTHFLFFSFGEVL